MTKNDIIRKITSRKFWLALCVFVTDILVLFRVQENLIAQVCALIMSGAAVVAYIIAEGLTDAAGAKAEQETHVVHVPVDKLPDDEAHPPEEQEEEAE